MRQKRINQNPSKRIRNDALVPLPDRNGEALERCTLLSVVQVCAVLGIGRTQFYRLAKSTRLSTVKIGKSVRVKLPELERYVESLDGGGHV